MDNGGIVRRGSVAEFDDEIAREFLAV